MATRVKKPAVIMPAGDGPAKPHSGHRHDRPVGLQAGAKKAWRNIAEHPLSAAFERGQLSRGSDVFNAKDRLNAGEYYRCLYEGAQVRSRDSTQFEVVLGGTGAGMGEARADAIRKLIAVDSRMKNADRKIIRRVCGEGWWPSEAVRESLGPHYAKAVVPRFNEALDALCEALAAARKGGWRVNG